MLERLLGGVWLILLERNHDENRIPELGGVVSGSPFAAAKERRRPIRELETERVAQLVDVVVRHVDRGSQSRVDWCSCSLEGMVPLRSLSITASTAGPHGAETGRRGTRQ